MLIEEHKFSSFKDVNFGNLKLTLKGLNNYYFLVNDSNNELKQHFDSKFNNNFNPISFNENLRFKREIFNQHNIEYYYFVVPDKSIICKEFLPFEYDVINRNINYIDDFIDFSDKLESKHYFKLDSHINYDGGRTLTFYFLNFIDKLFTKNIYEKLLSNGTSKEIIHRFDLLDEKNWSYSNEEKFKFDLDEKISISVPSNLIEAFDEIPSEFNFDGVRKSEFFKNENSFSDLRVLVFRDSNTNLLKWFFSFYFREIFFYWDHGYVNEDVIKWFNPDMIIELRTERLLENIPTPLWVQNKQNIFHEK